MTPVRLQDPAPRSRVKHSTTEPLGSLTNQKDNWPVKKNWVRLNKKQEGPWDLGRSPEND